MTGFAIYTTPFGNLRVEYRDGVVTFLKKLHAIPSEMGERTPLTDEVFRQIEEYLNGERREFDFKYEVKGTEFQKKVWKALCDIPYGETRTYKQIATAVGNPKASRAVGMANNRNPITIAVPCHRVIGANGKMVGYAGGVDMKIALLELEKSNKNN